MLFIKTEEMEKFFPEDAKQRAEELENLQQAIQLGVFRPVANLPYLVEKLKNEQNRYCRLVLWNILSDTGANEELKQVALDTLQDTDEKLQLRSLALSYLSACYPEKAWEWVQKSEEVPEDKLTTEGGFSMALARVRAAGCDHPNRARLRLAQLSGLLSPADPRRGVLGELMGEYQQKNEKLQAEKQQETPEE